MKSNNPLASAINLSTQPRSFQEKAKSLTQYCLYSLAAVMLFLASEAMSAVIDDIKADMLSNEAPLLNTTTTAAWAKGAMIKMGSAPRGDATPSWWKPDNLELKSASPWNVIVPWFVIYPGTSHKATNVRVKVYEISIFVLLKSTNEWKKIDTGDGKPGWAANYKFNLGTKVSKAEPRVESDGQLSYKLTSEFNPIHGSKARYDLSLNGVDPMDIEAAFVNAKTQLILDDPMGVDDRAAAQILFSIGADYYPTMTTTLADLYPMKSYPGLGGSRFGIVKTEPRTHYLTTIDPPGPLTAASSEYVTTGGLVALHLDLFEAHMPPGLENTDTDIIITVDVTAPSVPGSLSSELSTISVPKKGRKGTTTSTTKCILSWTASSDDVGVAGYYIYKNNTKIATTTSTSFSDSLNTATGTLYEYTVKAFDDAGNVSAASNITQIVY